MKIALHLSFLVALAFPLIPGSHTSQLYLQPAKPEEGYFTNDSFFITCLTTDESIDQLTWIGVDENEIKAKTGRIHIQPATGGQQGLELVVESVQKGDAGQYVCSDEQDSISFNLMVYSSISFGTTAKVQHAPEGESARLTCHVRADPTPSVAWYFNSTKLMDSPKYKLETDGLLIHDVSRADAGFYKCKAFVITHLAAQVKELDIDFQVQYEPEWIENEPVTVYASMGSDANITCSANANPEPKFEWQKDDEMIHNSSDHMILNSGKESILRFKVEDQEQFGEYECSATNDRGVKSKIIELKEGNAPDAPTVKVENEDQGTLTLVIKDAQEMQNELSVTGYRVQYVFSVDSWDQPNTKDFNKGEKYILKNVSHNSEYIIRAAARNAAGYSVYSEEIKYTTHSFHVASVVRDSMASLTSLPSVVFLLLSVFFLHLFY